MTAVGCDTVEVNPPQHSIKQREKCGLGTEATSIKNRLVGSGTPPCSSRETLDPGVVPVGRLDLQGSLPPAACTAVLHTWGIILPSAAVHESVAGTFRTWRARCAMSVIW